MSHKFVVPTIVLAQFFFLFKSTERGLRLLLKGTLRIPKLSVSFQNDNLNLDFWISTKKSSFFPICSLLTDPQGRKSQR